MRDELKNMKPWRNERGIVNLDSSLGSGTHWVAYCKQGKHVLYYDSFGDLPPPKELTRYLSGNSIRYNINAEQKFNSVNCGHLCLKFLVKSEKRSLT